MEQKIHQVVILGSGPAGLTAALYTARANLSPIVIMGTPPGGQLMTTTYVENWPGEKKILGPTLMANMMAQVKELGAVLQEGQATRIQQQSEDLFLVTMQDGTVYQTRTIIVATGARHKHLGCPGEQEYWTKGVSSCATCDGAFFKNKRVVVVGGGDTAMEDASFLRNYTKDITIIQIQPTLSASHAMQQRVIHDPTVRILYNSTVSAITGNGMTVTGVTVTNTITKESLQIPADGVFVAIGLYPNTDIFKDLLTRDTFGYLKVTDKTKSNIPGIFIAGDVHDAHYRQAITAAGSGCMAAMDTERYLSTRKASQMIFEKK